MYLRSNFGALGLEPPWLVSGMELNGGIVTSTSGLSTKVGTLEAGSSVTSATKKAMVLCILLSFYHTRQNFCGQWG